MLRGLLPVHRIKEVPKGRWSATPWRAEDATIPQEDLRTVSPSDPLPAVFDRMASEDVNQFPVMEDGPIVGMIARDALIKFIGLRTELQASEDAQRTMSGCGGDDGDAKS